MPREGREDGEERRAGVVLAVLPRQIVERELAVAVFRVRGLRRVLQERADEPRRAAGEAPDADAVVLVGEVLLRGVDALVVVAVAAVGPRRRHVVVPVDGHGAAEEVQRRLAVGRARRRRRRRVVREQRDEHAHRRDGRSDRADLVQREYSTRLHFVRIRAVLTLVCGSLERARREKTTRPKISRIDFELENFEVWPRRGPSLIRTRAQTWCSASSPVSGRTCDAASPWCSRRSSRQRATLWLRSSSHKP